MQYVIVALSGHTHLLFHLGSYDLWAKSQILSSVAPPGRKKLGYYFQSGTCLGALETHDILIFLWSIFCKCPVINVTQASIEYLFSSSLASTSTSEEGQCLMCKRLTFTLSLPFNYNKVHFDHVLE